MKVMQRRILLALVAVLCAAIGVQAGCEYHTNCAACVADTTCGWCGNDPFSAGGYGFTVQGDHTEGNPYSADAYMVGGVGKVKLLGTSSTASPGQPPDNRVVIGQNTRFTKQFRGYSSFDQGGYPMGENPFKIVVEVSGTYTLEIVRVYNDTYMEVKDHQVNIPDYIPFTLGTPRGRGALKYGPEESEVILPNSQSREQLTIVCQEQYSASTVNNTNACKFTKELKVGYWLVLDKADPVVHRVITSIKSDYELTVDADFTLSSATATDTLTHSNTDLALENEWTWVACPPRIGKRATGMGTIEKIGRAHV